MDNTDVKTFLVAGVVFIVLSVLILIFNKFIFPVYEAGCRLITYMFALMLFFMSILFFIIYAGYVQNPLADTMDKVTAMWQTPPQVTITIP